MYIHILFENGSNPYYRLNITHEEFKKELSQWEKNYNLTFLSSNKMGSTLLASDKQTNIDQY